MGRLDADRRFFVAQPVSDVNTTSSSGESHRLLVLKSSHWSTFNVALFGMEKKRMIAFEKSISMDGYNSE